MKQLFTSSGVSQFERQMRRMLRHSWVHIFGLVGFLKVFQTSEAGVMELLKSGRTPVVKATVKLGQPKSM